MYSHATHALHTTANHVAFPTSRYPTGVQHSPWRTRSVAHGICSSEIAAEAVIVNYAAFVTVGGERLHIPYSCTSVIFNAPADNSLFV